MGYPLRVFRLTPGLENVLFHYVCIEYGRGLMICPTQGTPTGSEHSKLLSCFHSTCSNMRAVLHASVQGAEGEGDDSGACSEGQQYVRKSVSTFPSWSSSVMEHGVLLQCSSIQSNKVKASLQYWVIG